MAKAEVATFWTGLLSAGLYKRSQGRLSRQLTALALGLIVAIGAYVLSQGPLSTVQSDATKIGVPVAIVVVAGWLIFRLVNYPVFAEFLISVEAEMNKVSWSSWDELVRATIVVLSTMAFLALVLLVYDVVWGKVLEWLGVIQT